MNANKIECCYRFSLEHEMSEMIQEQETPNEFDDVPIVDEPDDDETEIDEEERINFAWHCQYPEKKKRRGVAKRVKLPINMQSKYQRKCPICRGPMVRKCINCGYILQKGDKETPLFQKSKG